ncbi:hypothetical protein SNE40_020462 [Patella caerulea]|uniref:BTB domain-containing protein n=1 Tax=Patella caerulea TaxID=87958 RepID=A0AAN8IZP6_PATCE
MAGFSSMSPLLSTCEKFDYSDSEDSVTSSGYDSAVLSVGNWSDSEIESEDEGGFNSDDMADIMIFENTKPITNTMEYILSMPSLCDVVFIVGEDESIIRGLKAVLASRNRIFYDMLMKKDEIESQDATESTKKSKTSRFPKFKKKSRKSNQDVEKKLTVVIKDYDFNVFSRLISFLHLGEVSVTPETVVGLMCAADEFKIPELQQACWDFCFRCLDNGNIATIVQSSQFYRGRPAADDLMFKLVGMMGGPKTTSV